VRACSLALWLSLAAGGAACGGGDETQQPPVQRGVAEPAAVGTDTVAADSAAAPAQAQPGLVREVFAYRGTGRDPFLSLLRSGEVRPLFEDLRVTTITYDPRYPSNSVAVLRDTVVDRRYTVRVGDELGRMRIAEIRQQEVLVIMQEFGVERQRSLVLRRRREESP
jgi:hypothetical protein